MKLDVLAIGPHPDDVELGCGGTVAQLVRAGRQVGILHLTRGERGTRGSAAERRDEAERAAAALGVADMDFLDCGDGSFRTGEQEEEALIERLRYWRPDLVLGPPPGDRHPDHGRAHRLVHAATFYAGLARRGSGQPHRPAAVFCYMQHDPFEPSFVVDVTAGWEAKMSALAAYDSQLHQPGRERSERPVTKVATPEYRSAVEGRARHFGMAIGATFGEPFWSRLALAVGDPLSLLPGGVR